MSSYILLLVFYLVFSNQLNTDLKIIRLYQQRINFFPTVLFTRFLLLQLLSTIYVVLSQPHCLFSLDNVLDFCYNVLELTLDNWIIINNKGSIMITR